LRGAEALRLHNFIALETVAHHVEGLENYAAEYMYPSEITDRLGKEFTVALFPASLVGWKLVYIPISDMKNKGSFTTGLAVEKIPFPLEMEIDQSFIELSRVSSESDVDAISVTSDDSTSTISNGGEDEYVLIRPSQLRQTPVVRRGSVAMERGNGPKSPSDSVCDIVDMKPDKMVGAVEMLPGQKMLEKSDGLLIKLDRGVYVPRTEGLKKSFKYAGDFLARDNLGGSKFAKLLEGWNNLLGGRGHVI
jgi:hypothetical protein